MRNSGRESERKCEMNSYIFKTDHLVSPKYKIKRVSSDQTCHQKNDLTNKIEHFLVLLFHSDRHDEDCGAPRILEIRDREKQRESKVKVSNLTDSLPEGNVNLLKIQDPGFYFS